MAETVAEFGVTIEGRIGTDGEFQFSMAPSTNSTSTENGDLDELIDKWGPS